MLEDFVEYIKGNKMVKGITSKECSLQSHEMAFLAEKSRLEFSVEDMAEATGVTPASSADQN